MAEPDEEPLDEPVAEPLEDPEELPAGVAPDEPVAEPELEPDGSGSWVEPDDEPEELPEDEDVTCCPVDDGAGAPPQAATKMVERRKMPYRVEIIVVAPVFLFSSVPGVR